MMMSNLVMLLQQDQEEGAGQGGLNIDHHDQHNTLSKFFHFDNLRQTKSTTKRVEKEHNSISKKVRW